MRPLYSHKNWKLSQTKRLRMEDSMKIINEENPVQVGDQGGLVCFGSCLALCIVLTGSGAFLGMALFAIPL